MPSSPTKSALTEFRKNYSSDSGSRAWIYGIVFVVIVLIVIGVVVWSIYYSSDEKKSKHPSSGDLVSINEYVELSKRENYNKSSASVTEGAYVQGPYVYINDFED